jgi:hypothetical protein
VFTCLLLTFCLDAFLFVHLFIYFCFSSFTFILFSMHSLSISNTNITYVRYLHDFRVRRGEAMAHGSYDDYGGDNEVRTVSTCARTQLNVFIPNEPNMILCNTI